MKEIETQLRTGMADNGIPDETQGQIVKFITSFAEYGFPESHAASFALIAYASAFLKVRYLAAFTAALLNNYPMGFYHPATIVKDAQRHGLRVKPVDVMCSDWNCTLEHDEGKVMLRLGLRYVRGIPKIAAEVLMLARARIPFVSIDDLARRVPLLNKANLAMLARTGALNNISGSGTLHRRDALWQAQRAAREAGPLFQQCVETDMPSPLRRMDVDERLVADYHGTGLTVGPHPIAYRRAELRGRGVKSASELKTLPDGKPAIIAGCVITRQRPGTAKGLIFMTLEDETGTARVIIKPDFYEDNRVTVLYERFVQVLGLIQNRDGVVNLVARGISPLTVGAIETSSHDFH
jgi:error-prone DNA polymerase